MVSEQLRPNRNAHSIRLAFTVIRCQVSVLGKLIHGANRNLPTSRSAAEGVCEACSVHGDDKITVIPNGINPVFWSQE